MNETLNWNDLENIVALSVKDRYVQLQDQKSKNSFLKDLQRAQNALWDLSKGGNVNYELIRMGEAYSLYYHLRNADRICIALDEMNRISPLPTQMRILDIGSGTGSGVMAASFWMYQKYWRHRKHVKLEVTLVEKADSMHQIADHILNNLQKHMYLTKDDFCWNYQNSDWQTTSAFPYNQTFDLILFSYTFDAYNPLHSKVKDSILDLAQLLNPDGAMLFLTPTTKVDFINSLIGDLSGQYMIPLRPNINGKYFAPHRNPEPIAKLRTFFDRECENERLPKIFNGQEPYYGFSTQCDILFPKSIETANNKDQYTKMFA